MKDGVEASSSYWPGSVRNFHKPGHVVEERVLSSALICITIGPLIMHRDADRHQPECLSMGKGSSFEETTSSSSPLPTTPPRLLLPYLYLLLSPPALSSLPLLLLLPLPLPFPFPPPPLLIPLFPPSFSPVQSSSQGRVQVPLLGGGTWGPSALRGEERVLQSGRNAFQNLPDPHFSRPPLGK